MGSHGNQDIDVGDMRISKDSLFLMKEMADPTKVDFGQKERTDIENAPSIIRDQLKKSAREARHAKEKKDRRERHEHHKRREQDERRRSVRQEAEDRARSVRSSRDEGRDRRDEKRDDRSSRREERRPPLVPSSRLAGPKDVIRAKSRSGHEDSMMAKVMAEARSRSRGLAAPSSSDPLGPSSLDVTRKRDDKDITLTAGAGAIGSSSKASEFRVTTGGPVPSTSERNSSKLGGLRSSVLDRKMTEARDRSRYDRYDRSGNDRNDRSMSRYRSREDDYRERFRNLNREASRMRSRYDDRPSSGGDRLSGNGWRDDYRRSHRDRRDDRRDDRGRSRFRPSRPTYRSRDSRAEEIEKKDYLMAMEKMKMQGIQLTKNYTMEDSLVDIQYEFERHNLNLESIQKVETSKSYIRILAVVIVVINHFTGRHLKLVGWTEKLSRDLDNPKYFMALEEMCRSMHRRGPPSPWIQLAIMFVSSIFVTHVNNQWGLGIGGGNGGGGPGPAKPKDSGGGLGGLLGSLGGINLGSVLGTVGSMFGAGGGGAGPRPVPVVPHGPAPTGPPASSSSGPPNPSNTSQASTGSRSFRKPLVRP